MYDGDSKTRASTSSSAPSSLSFLPCFSYPFFFALIAIAITPMSVTRSFTRVPDGRAQDDPAGIDGRRLSSLAADGWDGDDAVTRPTTGQRGWRGHNDARGGSVVWRDAPR